MKVSIRAEVDVEGTVVPPVVIVVGNVGPLVAHYGGDGAPRPLAVEQAPVPAPAIARSPTPIPVTEVVPWTASETDRAAFYADAPDVGQHDIWKKEAAIVAWRFLVGADVPLARAWFDLDGRTPVPQPLLLPFSLDLIAACKRLGYLRLMLAAIGLTPESAQTPVLAADLPVAGAFGLLRGTIVQSVRVPDVPTPVHVPTFLRALYDAHEEATREWITTQRAEWERDVAEGRRTGAYDDNAAQAMFALAPAGIDGWERPDLGGLPSLQPLHLSQSPVPRTPATGAQL